MLPVVVCSCPQLNPREFLGQQGKGQRRMAGSYAGTVRVNEDAAAQTRSWLRTAAHNGEFPVQDPSLRRAHGLGKGPLFGAKGDSGCVVVTGPRRPSQTNGAAPSHESDYGTQGWPGAKAKLRYYPVWTRPTSGG